MSIKKECGVIAGNRKCCRCLKGKKGCKFTVADEEEEKEGNVIEEEELQKSRLLVAALKKILSLPIRLLHKRKEVDLLLGSVKERAKTSLVANHTRLESEALELEVDKDNSMPPPSIVPSQVPSSSSSSSHLFYPTKDFAICHLPVGLMCIAGGHYSHSRAVCVERIFIFGGNR